MEGIGIRGIGEAQRDAKLAVVVMAAAKAHRNSALVMEAGDRTVPMDRAAPRQSQLDHMQPLVHSRDYFAFASGHGRTPAVRGSFRLRHHVRRLTIGSARSR